MTGSRSPGRYNLHRLGWVAFEDFCMQIMRVVLGETSQRFRPGKDGGRDGWYRGKAAGKLVDQNGISGAVIVQCKHTSKTHEPLGVADLKKELEKLQRLAAETPCHYIVMTNRQVSAPAEAEIRTAAEAIAGVRSCLVLGETWVEDTVDAHPRLLRLVPRLYGIGDLSQIVSFVLQQQTRAVLDDLAVPLRPFVPTASYRHAERAFYEHGFVVLVGPPASGKTSIAANLCLITLAQKPDARVLRIERAEQFKDSWSPDDAGTVYWVDDVFGETTFDETRLQDWSSALEKVEAARRRKARIIFCTRDYILTSALEKLKRSKAEHINDARIRVDVTGLSWSEREDILYNHIKDGNISAEQKRALKKHLPMVARFNSFSPELARRLGNKRFHKFTNYDWKTLSEFFEKPVEHFRDVIHGLSNAETAALAACLHSGNALPDPVSATSISDAVLQTFNVSISEVRGSLERLEGSFVKRVRSANHQTWQFHHPSMLEALQKEIAERSSHLLLYLESAQFHVLLNGTSTLTPSSDSRYVFLPEATYAALAKRLQKFHESTNYGMGGVARYLVDQATPEFLHFLDRTDRSIIDSCLEVDSEPEDSDRAIRLAIALSRTNALFDERRKIIIRETLRHGVDQAGWLGFIDVEGVEDALPEFSRETVQADHQSGFCSVEQLYEWYAQDLSSLDHIDGARDAVHAHCQRLESAITRLMGHDPAALESIRHRKMYFDAKLARERAEREKEESEGDYDGYDDWRDSQAEERHELEHGRFSDVDE